MNDNVQIDTVAGGMGSGSTAALLLSSNFNVNALRPVAPTPNAQGQITAQQAQNFRANALLRRDEWIHFDNAIIEVSRERLMGVADLMSRGLTSALPNAMGKTQLEWETVSDMEGAEVSMAGVTHGQNDTIEFGNESMPIPIFHKQFNINIRKLASSRTLGESLDTTQARYAARKIAEITERTLFFGSTVLGSSAPLYGYLTQPKRNTGSVTASWLTATGEQILADVLRMINAQTSNYFYGPYVMYVPLLVYTQLLKDFKTDSDKSILSRLLEIPALSEIKVSEQLTGTNVLMITMSRDVVELIEGIQPTMIQWQSPDGMVAHFKIISIMPPRFRNDFLDHSGIVHFS